MAFSASTLYPIGGSVIGPRLWGYRTADAATVVDTVGYFNTAANILNVGDVILANTGFGGTNAYGFFTVLTNTYSQVTQIGVVNTSDALAIPVTNTR